MDKRFLTSLAIVLVISAIATSVFIIFSSGIDYPKEVFASFGSCVKAKDSVVVQGSSMEPMIANGETVSVLYGYYDCNSVKHNDIVLFKYAGSQDPLIKVAKAVPGDSFELKQNGDVWNIVVNGLVVTNSEGKAYTLTNETRRMLSLYERDYKNKIPENAFLILGDVLQGSLDSTRFGLVDRSALVAKVDY